MNLLVDVLPESVTIDHTEYQIDSSFRTCLTIILAFEDPELTTQEKQAILLSMLFVDMPPAIEETFKQAMWFLDGGQVSEKESTGVRLYSFEKDAQFVYSAFRQTHGIDLQKAELHWWEFLALFMDLGGETTFSHLTSLRKKLKTGKATKEEKEFARAHPEIVDVPDVDTRTLEEKETANEFLRKVEEARQRRNKT